MTHKGFVVVDLFCGAGGASHAAIRAILDLGGEIKRFIAVNHWDSAIATHNANHPFATHYCDSVSNVKPLEAVPGRRVHLLLAGPECTFHSKAAGDRPINDQSRIAAWSVLNWIQDLYVDNVVIENVPEFRDWGPLNADGSKNKKLKGKTFLAYLAAIRALGYRVEWRILCAADYGDPTSRERLFIIARRGNKPINWPEPTHTTPQKIREAQHQPALWKHTLKPHRTAREIIDWGIPGVSIFNRAKPLSPNTMRRIMAGLYKFGLRDFILPNEGKFRGNAARSVDEPLSTIVAGRGAGGLAQPFIVKLYNTNDATTVDGPLPTVTAQGQHLGLVQPFVIGQQSGGAPRSVDDPLPTVAAAGAIALVQPFIIGAGGPEGHRNARSVDNPLPTVTGTNTFGVVQPFVLTIRGGDDGYMRGAPVDAPVPAITTSPAMALVTPYIIPVSHGKDDSRAHSVDEPLPTITGVHNLGVVHPYVFPIDHQGSLGYQVRSVDEPVGTITTKNRLALAQPYIVKYYGTGDVASVDVPLGTITTKDRFALCVPIVGHDGVQYLLLDILFRMFEPHELSAAMSFPSNYVFVSAKPKANKPISKKEAVKMIGNAWPGETGRMLCMAAIS